MGYNITLYRVTDDPRSISKNVSNTTRIAIFYDVKFKQGRGMVDLVYDLQIAENNSNYQGLGRATYATLSGTNISGLKTYYYFVDKVEYVRTGLIRYHLREDPLMTWRSDLLNLNVTLDRSETIFNGYLPDGEYTALGYRAIVCKAFPDALDDDSYVLMTTG